MRWKGLAFGSVCGVGLAVVLVVMSGSPSTDVERPAPAPVPSESTSAERSLPPPVVAPSQRADVRPPVVDRAEAVRRGMLVQPPSDPMGTARRMGSQPVESDPALPEDGAQTRQEWMESVVASFGEERGWSDDEMEGILNAIRAGADEVVELTEMRYAFDGQKEVPKEVGLGSEIKHQREVTRAEIVDLIGEEETVLMEQELRDQVFDRAFSQL